eukprot:COSAG02_NODE_5628_length_4174_cov_3.981591_2_plen_57_part_00
MWPRTLLLLAGRVLLLCHEVATLTIHLLLVDLLLRVVLLRVVLLRVRVAVLRPKQL